MALQLGPVIGSIGGGGVEEIPVSMSGGGGSSSSPTAYPLTTFDAGDGAVVLVVGTMDPSTTSFNGKPLLQIGSYTHGSPHEQLTGPEESGIGMIVTGTVEISILSRHFNTTSFTGTVYVAHL